MRKNHRLQENYERLFNTKLGESRKLNESSDEWYHTFDEYQSNFGDELQNEMSKLVKKLKSKYQTEGGKLLRKYPEMGTELSARSGGDVFQRVVEDYSSTGTWEDDYNMAQYFG